MTLEWKDLARGGRLRAVAPLPFVPLLRGQSQSSPRPQDHDGRGKRGQPARASVCVFRGTVPCVLTHRLWSVRTWWHLLKPWAESSEVDIRTHNHSPSSPVYSPGSTVLSNTVSVFALWKTEAGGGVLCQVQDPHAGLCTSQAPSTLLEQTRTVRDPIQVPAYFHLLWALCSQALGASLLPVPAAADLLQPLVSLGLLTQHHVCLCRHRTIFPVYVCPNLPLLKTCHCIRATPLQCDLTLADYTCKDPTSKQGDRT